jgi:hypothetical protein
VSDPRVLLDQVLLQFWDAVAALSRAAATSPSLTPLNPLPQYARAPFNSRVLDQIDTLALADPVAVAAFALVRGLVPDGVAASNTARLHGWDPGGGRSRSLALLLQPAGGLPCDVAIAFETGADGAPSIQVVASAPAGGGGFLDAGSGLKLNVQVTSTGDVEFDLRPGGAAHTAGGAGLLVVGLSRPADTPITIGPGGGPVLTIHGINADVRVTLIAPGTPPAVALSLAMNKLEVDVLPTVVAGLLGGKGHAEIAVDLRADSAGVQIGSGGTRAMATNRLTAGGVRVDSVGVDLLDDGPPHAPLGMGFTFGVAGKAPGLPVAFGIDGVGAAFPIRVGRGASFGFDVDDIRPLPPTGISAELTLPFASGSGILATGPNGSFVGAFDIDLGFVSIRALAVLQPADGGHPVSLAVLMFVEFPFPGIQLGLGFALTAIGGIVAINRRTNFEALEAAVLDGRATSLLAPATAGSNPSAALSAMVEIFPEARGRIVIGPLLQISWGGRLITLTISLIFDLPSPPTLAVLGRLVIAIPDPAAPLVLIGVTFVARFDPSIPMVRVTGSLVGSYIVFLPLQGDAFVLVQGGSHSNLIVSAGGFHPDYPRPAGTPALRRIAFDLSPLPVPRMRAETYFALTANSVQFGAAVYLAAKLAGCGIEGRFSFDALCVFAPSFAFKAQASGRVAVEAFGQTLIAVSLDILLEGPSPWHVRGRGSVSLLWEDISLDFEVTWGDAAPLFGDPPPIEDELRRALKEPRNWVPDSIGAERSGVVLRPERRGEEPVLHPLGRLHVRQQRVPFEVTITRYDGEDLRTPQRWAIEGARLGSSGEFSRGDALRDEFPRAHYFGLSESDQLSSRGFTREVSGAVLVAETVRPGRHLECPDTEFDEKVIVSRDGAPLVPRSRRRGVDRIGATTTVFDAALGSRRMHEEKLWWADDGRRAVVVRPHQPLVVATVNSLAEEASVPLFEDQSPIKSAQTLDAALARGLQGVQLVERWEARSGA